MKLQKLAALGLIVGISAIGGVQVQAAETQADSISKIGLVQDSSVTTPVDPTDPSKPGPNVGGDGGEGDGTGGTETGQTGTLTMDWAPNFLFGDQKITGKTEVYNSISMNPFVQITDKRGLADGKWALTATMTKLTSGTKELKGDILTLSNGVAKTTPGNLSAAPTVNSSVKFENQASTKVFDALGTNQGMGTWISTWAGSGADNANVTLEVPAGNEEGTFQGTITWTLTDTPA